MILKSLYITIFVTVLRQHN